MNSPDARRAGTSLRRRLLVLLLAPLFLLALISGLIDYRIASSTAETAFDHGLADDALALASRVALRNGELAVDLPPAAEAILRTDSEDAEFLAVRGPDGRLLGGDADLMPDAVEAGRSPVLTDIVMRGRPVRKASYAIATPAGLITVAFAETTNKRDEARSRIMAALLIPNVLILIATFVLVYFGIAAGLAPLNALSRAIEETPRTDIRPLDGADVPQEAAPLVAAINRLLDDLAASAAAQRAFLSNAAHQLRTPLAGLQTQLELAAQDLPPAHRSKITRLVEATGRIARLAGQLLALARSAPEASAGHPVETIDLATVIAENGSDWYDRALARRVDLEFETAPAPLIGSAWLIGELAGNLIDNAVAYAGPEAGVMMRSGVDALGRAFLEVEDDGPGVPAAERERIFERFYRAEGQTAPGTGLGLAIVKEVADRHRATVSLRSRPDFPGCLVRVTFPAPDARAGDGNRGP
ncbi:sensor histidine kinase [Prosthecomicrobium hirschii]|uniref:sensor histidine kinase n=1 Tax=Prosthecodimorpha hirschii TaxID=665126 RepID=UPI002220F29A|nr:sensor histidine kinase [Prosthecomicrobium hirschii]MCW1843402.1 sensor histidine kinase [Prosthecomicrobium hirschii]